ncbi:hypothetical protein CROQUDRAFT_655269 [Cronartium quercuum f. sp. fusiforme G11]|uniref:Uncharacterized protein n=1 Tax=Cronartium quercuum f. sp. fusiforme G11 TaxID=708437 RepID=A0A9P6TDW8_9BASI|nr:hypothetical protein CROQUDRAFT_655269 [Cronartium quercuum f. sp. fusiforme G11]
MVRLVVEFKGSTGKFGEEGSVRLNIKLVRPDDEPKPEGQENPKGKRREDLFGTRRHVIAGGVLIPCRFAGLAVTFFTLGQLAGIACSTATGTDATNAYRGLRRLGQSIAMLETKGRDERRKKARTSGLVDRLRERLRKLKRPDEIRLRASRRGVPLERVERSAADLVGAEDGLRRLPVLGS